MRCLYRKLASRRGETLIETLVAILIVALAAAIFAGMTLSASHLNAAAIDADEAFFAELSAAETQAGSASSDPIVISWTDYNAAAQSQSCSVTRVGSGNELRSYTDAGGGG